MTAKYLNIGTIMLHEKLQSRVCINQEMVDEYAECMEKGDEFPPVSVYFDGVNYMLVDGYHRYHATRKTGKAGIECIVTHGTFHEAFLASLKANSKHGMRRTNEDRRKAVVQALEDEFLAGWSDRKIAEACDVSHPFVAKVRASLAQPERKPAHIEKPAKPAKQKEEKVEEQIFDDPAPSGEGMQQEAIDVLIAENEQLKDRLAVAAIDATEEERRMAQTTIEELRESVRTLNIELVAVKSSRDAYQTENSQLKKQVTMLQKKLRQAGIE